MWTGQRGDTCSWQFPKLHLQVWVFFLRPGQSCCHALLLRLHVGLNTTITVAPEQWHNISLATKNRDIFSQPSLLHKYSTSILFVEIQKYYGQPSRWFYAKLIQNIEALEGKQTLRRCTCRSKVVLKGVGSETSGFAFQSADPTNKTVWLWIYPSPLKATWLKFYFTEASKCKNKTQKKHFWFIVALRFVFQLILWITQMKMIRNKLFLSNR